ncbi:VWA domain-containing protein, partial [Arcobacter vandammei]|uniref:VWA domain-containing protein n=1 Tax=Arcobacter vandammei TaxID=2782243 RepID=UPI0018E007B3
FAEGSEDLVVKITDLDKDVTSFENIKVGTQDTATSTILDNDFKLSTDDSFTICEDTEYKLSINDFGTPLTTITKVKIVELPTNGQLLLNGVAITAGQEISRADIDSGKLVFKPTLHTDVDGNFEFLVHDGSKWATVENTTEIIINAVADAPTTSIDVTKTSTSSSSSFVVEVGGNTYNITDILVNKGTYTEVKNVGNNTSTNATNIVVNENLDANNFLKTSGANNIIVINGDISGGAKIEPMGGNDFIAILGDLKGGVINDSAGIDTLYLGKDSSYYTWDVNTHSGQTGMDGTITQWADKEHTIKVGTLYINNIDGIIFADGKTIGDVTTQNSTIEEYEVDISASLVDRDGSETLTVEISGVPAGAILTSPGNKYQLVDKGNGVWEVKVDSNNPMDVKDKLLLTNVKNGSGWVDLKITATATEGGESCDNGKSKDSVASDATVYGVGESNQVCMEEFKYNLVITLDNSGSMNGTPMTLAKAAMVNLVNKYTQLGDVKVLLNVFNNYGEIKGVWVSPTEAISLINGITAGGGTNYDDALLKNIATLNSNPAPLDGKTISYFVSDGNPTFRMEKNSNGVWVQKGNGSATEYVTKAISDQWKNLDIDKSYAIGIGTNELNTHLNNVSSDVTIISNANQLSDALEGTVQELIYTGTVSDNIIGGDGAIKIDSIVVDGIVYTKSTFPANGVITGNNKIKLTFDFTTGEYKYYAKSSKFSVEDVGFKVNASDSNGDLTSFDVGLKVKVATEVMAPTASIDVINTSTIDYKNATVTTKGYTLEAYNLNGTKGEISIVAGTNVSGFGVKGASSGDESEIGYLNGKSEELRVKFDNKVTDVNVKFSWLASSETAKISFYKDGVLVGTTTQKGLTDTIDGPFNLKPSNGSLFDEIRFSGNGTNDDYIIHSIEYSEVVVDNGGVITDEVYNVNFEAALTGDKGTLSVTISNVPDGASFDLPNMKNLGNGVWEVTISEDDKSIDYSNVKMTVPAGTNYVDLKITATATGDTNCILPENTKTAIDSDATLYAVSESEQAKMNAFKYNLVLTIDNSGSMNGNPITLAKAAMVNLVNKYTQLGDVKVFLTTFSNTAEIKGVWVDAAKAVELINKISTINMTNYDDALLKVIGAMNSTPVPYNDGKTISYFVSDGLPNYGMTKNSKGEWVIKSNANSVNAELSSQYKNLNFDKSYAIGIGTSALNTHLNAVSNDVTIISSATQLSQTLEDTVQELLVEGNFLDNVIGGDGKITADTITFEGKVYTKDTFPSNGIVAGDNHIKLTIDFETGDYRYYAKSSKFTEETKVFTVEASDNNGDKVKYDIEADVKVVTGKAENVQQLMGDDIDLTKVITKTTDVIDLENSSTTDKLKVDLQDILDLNKQQLIIKGDKGDIVELDKNDWTQSGNQKIDGKDYKVYSHNSNVKLLIDDDIDTHNI